VNHQKQPSADKKGIENILKEAAERYRMLYALLAGCGAVRAGEALGLEIDNTSAKTAAHSTFARRRSGAKDLTRFPKDETRTPDSLVANRESLELRRVATIS